jgi:hypothetical protein
MSNHRITRRKNRPNIVFGVFQGGPKDCQVQEFEITDFPKTITHRVEDTDPVTGEPVTLVGTYERVKCGNGKTFVWRGYA